MPKKRCHKVKFAAEQPSTYARDLQLANTMPIGKVGKKEQEA